MVPAHAGWKARSAAIALGAVLGTGLLSVGNTLRIEHTANDVIAHAREIANAPATHEHDRMLLQIVAFARDIRSHFNTVGEPKRATLRRAEFGFLGVMVLTCKQTPRFCGQACMAGCFGLRDCCAVRCAPAD